eukprot:1702189-Prymnesium_polylepis.1
MRAFDGCILDETSLTSAGQGCNGWLLGVPRGGSRVVVVLRVHDRRFVLSSLLRMRAWGARLQWRFFVPRSHAGGFRAPAIH